MSQALPIDGLKEPLVAACGRTRRIVLRAPTGSGKSTRIPQMLLDLGLVQGQIVVLQPRRIAARLLAARIAQERGVKLGGEVGYQIRFERVESAETRIKFVTEALLLRQMASDPQLRGVGAVVFDETVPSRVLRGFGGGKHTGVAIGNCHLCASIKKRFCHGKADA